MKGQMVIIRSFGDKPLIRRVWDTSENLVYITNDKQFQLLIEGKKAIEPIGFPREDIFQYDPEIAKSLNKGCDWNKLKSWNGN